MGCECITATSGSAIWMHSHLVVWVQKELYLKMPICYVYVCILLVLLRDRRWQNSPFSEFMSYKIIFTWGFYAGKLTAAKAHLCTSLCRFTSLAFFKGRPLESHYYFIITLALMCFSP